MSKFSRNAWVGLVALPIMILLTGAGCNPTQNLAERAAEKAIEKASGNKVDFNTDGQGNVTIKGKDGSLSVGGNNSRPESAPADLPSTPSAKNFFWVGSSGSGLFSYEVESNDYKAVCAAQLELLAKAGWEKSDSYEMDVEKVMIRSFTKSDAGLTVTCGDNTEEGANQYVVSVSLNKMKR
ncbi:MAG: hypothetical protein Q7K39_02600 [Candidatus Magasanikbacteria bacterium]|nr:hypothetical protein [Candidatus Magasanikbacteria bacterium]